MTYLKASAKGFYEVSVSALMKSKNILVINGDITSELANQFVKNLITLCLENPGTLIKVLITTNGGSVDAGMLIYDAIRTCPNPIYVYGLEKIYSMGSVILIAGQKSFILPNSKMMIHKPWTSQVAGNATDLTAHANTLKKYESKLIQTFVDKTGKSNREIRKMLNYDHFLDAKEALDYGFVDEIVGINHILESEANYEI